MSSDDANGYAEPFRQLLEVSRQNVVQATEQTMLLRQVVDHLREVEGRHVASVVETRAVVRQSAESMQRNILAEMRASEGWWRRAVWIVGIAAALGGASSLVRVVQAVTGKP